MAVELGLTPDSRWDTDVTGLVSALAGAGLRCHELLALVIGADAEATLRQARQLAEAAAVVSAEWVLTMFAAPPDGRTAALIERCAAMFAEAGARMAVEFSPLGAVPTLRAALDVVAAAGAGRAGVLIDTWHFFRGDSTWEQLSRVPLDQIAYVQFDDAPPPVSGNGIRETMHRRVMPGDGMFDLSRFASTLLDRGWSGLVSVEVLNAGLRELPVPDFARRAYETTAPYWL